MTEIDSNIHNSLQKDYKETPWLPVLYATFYRGLREIAINHGYCLATHGSMQRDFDLIAVPWIDEPKDHFEMLVAMAKFVGYGEIYNKERFEKDATIKPQNRIAYHIQIGGGGYLDISVIIPKIKEGK